VSAINVGYGIWYGKPYGALYGILYMAHKPPSRLKYEKENPLVSIRLTRPLRENVDKIKGDATYPQAVRKIIMGFPDIIIAFQKVMALMPELQKELKRLQKENEALRAQIASGNSSIADTKNLPLGQKFNEAKNREALRVKRPLTHDEFLLSFCCF